jgi:hypothetical protein
VGGEEIFEQDKKDFFNTYFYIPSDEELEELTK